MGRFYLEQHRNMAATGQVRRCLSLAASVAIASVIGISIPPTAASAQHIPPRSGGYGLQLNDSGDAVADLQYQLSTMGYYNGAVTGYFDATTQEAVYRFQQDQGLAADGIVGPSTGQMLFQGAPPAYGASSSAARQGGWQDQSAAPNSVIPQDAVQLNVSGAQVTELQSRLAELGYYNGGISGTFDYETEAAVMQFQRDQGLATDGVVGPSTAASLRRPTTEIMRAATSPNQTFDASQGTSGAATNPNDDLLRLGETGQSVSDLQLRLKELGFYQGEITGTYGPETEAAVTAFQQSRGLITDGIAGPQVSAALFNFGDSSSGNVDNSSSTSNAAVSPTSATSSSSTSGTGTSASTGTVTNGSANGGNASASNSQPNSQVTMEQLEQARQEAQQAQLQAQQAQAVLFQNLEEGTYSIATLQRQLQEQGYYPGEINGMLTAQTQTAIAAAQQHYKLSPSDLLNSMAVESTVPASSEVMMEATQTTETVQTGTVQIDSLFPY